MVQQRQQHSHKKSTRKPEHDPKQAKRKRAAQLRNSTVQQVAEADTMNFRDETIGIRSHQRSLGSWEPPNVGIALPARRSTGFFEG